MNPASRTRAGFRFTSGTWNGDVYTDKDLDDMVEAYNDTKANMTPPLKLGHNEEQRALFQDGLPAAGWIGNLYIKAGKLIADFVDIPSRIAQLLERKAYKKVSAEIFWDIEFNGKYYNRMLAGVALLGGQIPAVNNLSDILALYGIDASPDKNKHYRNPKSGLMIKSYHTEIEEEGAAMPKSEAEIKLEFDLKSEQDKVSVAQAQAKNYEKSVQEKDAAIAAKDKELAEAREYKKNAEAKSADDAKALAESNLDKAIVEMESSKLISVSMKPYIKALLSEEKKEYSLKIGDKEEKLSKVELVKQVLKLHAKISSVNFIENSEENSVEGNKDEAALNAAIEKHMQENKVNYSVAYRAVMKTQKSE